MNGIKYPPIYNKPIKFPENINEMTLFLGEARGIKEKRLGRIYRSILLNKQNPKCNAHLILVGKRF